MTHLTPITRPGGSDGQVQFNNAGVFGGETALFWDDANNRLGINDATPSAALEVQDSAPPGSLIARFITGGSNRIDLILGAETTVTLVNSTPQQWRFGIRANNDFFIKDGSAVTIPFNIEDGAPNDAFFMQASGFLGLNEANAGAQLHIQTSGTGVIGLLIKATASQTANIVSILDSAGAELFVVNETGEVSIGGVTPVAGTKLLLPQENDAVTPTLAFGDGDSGIFEPVDDVIAVAINSVDVLRIDADGLVFELTNRPAIRNEAPSATNPVFIPQRLDLNTGIGSAATDTLSLIAGGIEMISIVEGVISDKIVMTADAVGINESSPGAQLHIQTSGTGVIGQIIKATASQTADLLRITDSADAVLVVVDESGNTGFGIADPAFLVDILGIGVQPLNVVRNNAGVVAQFVNSGFGVGLSITGISTNNILIRTNAADELLNFAGGGSDTPHVTIGTTGDVGVGVVLPLEKFQVNDAIAISSDAEGSTARLTRRTTHETHTLSLAATSDTTTISIPSGARLLGVSLNVNTAVVDDAGDDTWSAAFITGSTTTIVTGAAAAQNTKVDFMVPDEKTTGVTEIQFTPQGGSFSAGVIEIVAYYEELTSLANV